MSNARENASAQPKQQTIILVFAVVVPILIVVGFMYLTSQTVQKIQAETNQFRNSLAYVAENQATYTANVKKREENKAKLIAADPKIANKLTSMASSLGFDVKVSSSAAKKIEDSGVDEQEITVTFQSVDYDKFLDYIIQIHKLDTPIYMRHLQMSRASNNTSEDTKMSVTIALMSYRLKEQ